MPTIILTILISLTFQTCLTVLRTLRPKSGNSCFVFEILYRFKKNYQNDHERIKKVNFKHQEGYCIATHHSKDYHKVY